MTYPMLIDAVLTPAEIALLPEADLSDATCVVFDVLRATSSMVTALAHGAKEILPVRTIEEALDARALHPQALLGGERQGERIEGFDLGNSPFEYCELSGRSIISTTTNGTVALRGCEKASRVLVGAILNLGAVAQEIRRSAPARVVLVCAGTFTTFALEDAWAAGRLIQLLEPADLTDAAEAVLAIAQVEPEPLAALGRARKGKTLTANGRAAEIEWCAQESRLDAVGEMRNGRITRCSFGSPV
jgi:2-phosphosulfolactate phosphatase